jgi:hypothetical protein
MTTIKLIASALDSAAGRVECIGGVGATTKQCWYLASLIHKAGESADDIGCGIADTSSLLTKAKASLYIDDYSYPTVLVNELTVDYEAAVNIMDDDIREAVHDDLAPCGPQEFVDAYCASHLIKFGEDFIVN